MSGVVCRSTRIFAESSGADTCKIKDQNAFLGTSKTPIFNTEENRDKLTTSVRQAIERLGPYQSIVLLAVPTSLIEPLKLVALAIAGEGHWITGTAMIIAAYAGSLFVVERLFRIVKPKLMTLSWFAKLWAKILIARGKVIALFQRS